MKKPLRIGLVGFGRIGRNIFHLAYKNPNYQFVAISDLGEPKLLHYLLVRDSVYGPMKNGAKLEGNFLVVDGQRVRLLPGGVPGEIAWDLFNVDVVIDATGRFRKFSELEKHIKAGAKRVFVTTPPEDEIDRIVILGINDNDISVDDRIVSSTSSTTQVLALMLKILDEHFGVKRAMMTTVHAYTSDQPLADTVGSNLRRCRSAVENIIPNETFAPEIVESLMPKFKGKICGVAFNVPIPDGSCVDLTSELERMPDVSEVNEVVKKVAEGSLKGIVGYTEDLIVSSDVIGVNESMIFDAKATMITSNSLLKTICWYDNGWGFSNRILELIDCYARLEGKA
ncbi:MAG: type I glyceraldehyde-3-phosphate dehydrogenase [Candidatus Marinimicrobia bacterium]|nr:type I glyceraldehyde-3-phosphate dehydrogenase [Candidatus Neomarinimicrobiota bacterium]